MQGKEISFSYSLCVDYPFNDSIAYSPLAYRSNDTLNPAIAPANSDKSSFLGSMPNRT